MNAGRRPCSDASLDLTGDVALDTCATSGLGWEFTVEGGNDVALPHSFVGLKARLIGDALRRWLKQGAARPTTDHAAVAVG